MDITNYDPRDVDEKNVVIIHAFDKIAFEYYLNCAEKALNEGEDLPNIIIQNMAICYAHCIEVCRPINDPQLTYYVGDTVYDGCFALFKKYGKTPSLFPIDVVISNIFPIMSDIYALTASVAPDIDTVIFNMYVKRTEESYLHVANMLTIMYTHIPNFLSAKFTHDCIIHCMKSDLQGTRKAGVEALRALLRNHYEGRYNESLPKDYLSIWETYISIYETFDEFPLHLIKDMWSRIQPIQKAMRSTLNTDYYVYYWRAGEDKLPPEKREFGRVGNYPVEILLEEGDYKSVLLKSEMHKKDYYWNTKRRDYDFETSYKNKLKNREHEYIYYSRNWNKPIYAGFEQVGMEWMELLFERGLKHSNPQVRMFVMNRLLMVLPLPGDDCDDYSEDEPAEPEPEPYYFGYDRNLVKHYDYHGDDDDSDDSDGYLEKAKLLYSHFPPEDTQTKPKRSSCWQEEMRRVRLIPADTREESERFAWMKRQDTYHNYRHKVNMFVMSPAFLLHTLLPCLNNNALFKGDTYGIGYLLTSYLIHYPCCVPEFWTDMLTIIASTGTGMQINYDGTKITLR